MERGALSGARRVQRGLDINKYTAGSPGQTIQTAFEPRPNTGFKPNDPGWRNLRTVWILGTSNYAGEHYAAFPVNLPLRCIKAATSEHGVCPACGAPWRRITELVNPNPSDEDKITAMIAKGVPRQKANLYESHQGSELRHVGFEPGCTCNVEGIDLKKDDLEIIETPLGRSMSADESHTEDLSEIYGRAGFGREHSENEGVRPITRYEQRQYAAQIKQLSNRAAMEQEAGGKSIFAHYIRIDRAGARPIPEILLNSWLDRGWLIPVKLPKFTPFKPIPATVLDPFIGSGTTAVAARKLGRNCIGLDLSFDYLRQTQARLGHTDLMEWQAGQPIDGETEFSDLPLFGG